MTMTKVAIRLNGLSATDFQHTELSLTATAALEPWLRLLGFDPIKAIYVEHLPAGQGVWLTQ
jgi:hypothetical protein